MASSEHLPVNPRPPDPGRNPTSHEGTVCSENTAPIPMDPMDSLISAGKTIALLQLITNTPMIIVDENHNLTSRLQDLQELIYREVSNMRVSNVFKLYDLLEHYHDIISNIHNHIHSGPISMEVIDKYAKDIDEFRDQFALQVSLINGDHRGGGDMFPNCNNIAISGGNFVTASVATVTYINPQTSTNDKLVKLAYVQIGFLFSTAGHV